MKKTTFWCVNFKMNIIKKIIFLLFIFITQVKSNEIFEETFWYNLYNVTTLESDSKLNLSFNDSIVALSFTDSQIYTLTSEICEAYPNLTHLHVKGVSLQKVDDGAFGSCVNLEELDLSYNKLTALDDVDIFKNNLKMKIFAVEHNLLQTLNPNVFAPLTELTHLHLAFNNFSEFNIWQLQALPKLEFIAIDQISVQNVLLHNLVRKFPEIKVISLFDIDGKIIQISTHQNMEPACYFSHEMIMTKMMQNAIDKLVDKFLNEVNSRDDHLKQLEEKMEANFKQLSEKLQKCNAK